MAYQPSFHFPPGVESWGGCDQQGAIVTDPCVVFPPRAALGVWHTRFEMNR